MATHPAVEAFILRRAQILEFICDQEATRYKKYIQLLGLAAIDDMQRSFVDAAQTAESSWQASQQSLTLQLRVFGDPATGWFPATLASVLTKCSEAAGVLGVEDLKEWTGIESTITRLEAKRSTETKTKIDAFNGAIASLERPMSGSLIELVTNINDQHVTLRALKAASDDAAASGIIQEAIGFFDAHQSIVTCPLCEQVLHDGYAATFDRLKHRNLALARLRDSEAKRSQFFDQLIAAAQRCADQLTKDLESASLFLEDDVKQLRDTKASALRWWRRLKRSFKKQKLDEIALPKKMETVSSLRQRLHDEVVVKRNALIPPDAAKLENAIAFLKKAKTAEPNIRSAEMKLCEAAAKRQGASDARDAFTQAREKAIQAVLDQIASKVLTYYKKLHDLDGEAEKSECTGLSLKPTSRARAGGLNLAIQFLGLADSCDPRAFLSEGHLDSLGLCLYLATVRTFNPTGTLLVLDDVLTSIDKDHRHRVAELLFEEFADFQLVLTTHDEHWFGILQSKAQARGDQGKWLFKRIVRWTLELGPESAAFESTWEYIDVNLTEDSYRELGGPLRLVLEDFLKRAAEKLELEVRYKSDGRHTSGDFVVAGIHNEVRDGLIGKCPSEENDIKRDVGRVFGTGDLINFLSHENPGRLEVTLPQTKDFVTGLKGLTKRCQDNQMIKGISG
jgi:hypothetical protein